MDLFAWQNGRDRLRDLCQFALKANTNVPCARHTCHRFEINFHCLGKHAE